MFGVGIGVLQEAGEVECVGAGEGYKIILSWKDGHLSKILVSRAGGEEWHRKGKAYHVH